MKSCKIRKWIAAFFFVPLWMAFHSALAQDVLKYVDPNIGTAHSRWFFYTPAALPQGMAKLAPSTNAHYGNASGWEAVGYDVRDNSIEGFVNFHEWQLGGVSIMPATGPLRVVPGDTGTINTGYRSRFKHENELAQPGYYKVLLDDYNITAELTATKRVGFHQYTFPKSNQSRIILDIGNVQGESGDVLDASVRMIDERHFEGFVSTFPKYLKTNDPKGSVTMYFWGEVSKNPSTVGAFNAAGIKHSARKSDGKGAGLFLEYQTTKGEQILVKIALSYTSIANAKKNFEKEASTLTFNEAKRNAKNIWRNALSKIVVESDDESKKTKFYTALFHALLGRGIANDINGEYPAGFGNIGQLPLNPKGVPEYDFINTDAVWGAYWNLTQLWALSYPDYYNDFVQTQLAMYQNRGWFGDGIVNGQFVSGVGTNFVGLVIAAAYNCGFRDYDVNVAYQAVKKNVLTWQNRKTGAGKEDLKSFIARGYVPFIDQGRSFPQGSNFSASHTLEYSFGAFAAAQMAKSLGKEDDYTKLMNYSNGWKKLFDSSLKLIRPKDINGKFIDEFDPYQPWRGFQEGNAIQYSFFVPQNPASLIEAIGRENFNKRLDVIFENAQKNGFGGGKVVNAFAGVKSAYNHGNQPDMQMSWLFNFSGKPWLTQKWTRAICAEFYGTQGVHGYGYGQDEDQGQLGSWYVISSLGLFDVKGFTDRRPIIEIGSPFYDKATIKLRNGKLLIIEARNNSDANVYIQSAKWNNKPLNSCWLYRDELMKGGKLEFVMGNKPNKKWGTKNPPPSVQ